MLNPPAHGQVGHCSHIRDEQCFPVIRSTAELACMRTHNPLLALLAYRKHEHAVHPHGSGLE